MKKYRIGFTLTELLVVIAVIALLASMLLPALQKAKMKSREIQCGSNLRQWSVICYSYTNDYNGLFPPYQVPYGGGVYGYPVLNHGSLIAILENYMSVKSGWKSWASDLDQGSNYMLNKAKAGVLSCPSATIPKVWGMDYGENAYLGACSIGSQAYGVTAIENRRFLRLGRIPGPSKIIFWADSKCYWIYDSLISLGNIEYRHNNGLNILYVDGHVGWKKYPLPEAPASTDSHKEPWI